MTPEWDAVVGNEIGVGADVTVPINAKRVAGRVDAFWIPAKNLRAFPTEVRMRVRVDDAHGTWWVGPHTLVERA